MFVEFSFKLVYPTIIEENFAIYGVQKNAFVSEKKLNLDIFTHDSPTLGKIFLQVHIITPSISNLLVPPQAAFFKKFMPPALMERGRKLCKLSTKVTA